jgi:hypothetical protein
MFVRGVMESEPGFNIASFMSCTLIVKFEL